MAAQAFTNHAGGPGANQPTSYVAADGFTGPPAAAFNPNSPTFGAATFPYGAHGVNTQIQVPVQAVSATATAFTIPVPAGGTVTTMQFATTTAFTGATVSGEIGSASADASYVAATSVKNGGIVTLAPVASTAAASALTVATSGGLIFTLAQGTPSATGSGTLIVNYTLP